VSITGQQAAFYFNAVEDADSVKLISSSMFHQAKLYRHNDAVTSVKPILVSGFRDLH
jgi:hypothetical protein